jgi:hypothetical protein
MGARQLQLETIGDLRRAGRMLEFVCSHCSIGRLFDPYLLPFGDLQSVAKARRRMRCSFCGCDGDGSFTRTAPAHQGNGRHLFAIAS